VKVHAATSLALALLAAGWAASAQAGQAFLIDVADTSAYRLSHADLAAQAPGLGEIDSGRLRLSLRGEPRRLHVDDGGDGRFGPGDSLSFYGERLHGLQSWFDTYAVNNVYRLEIAADDAAPAPAWPQADAPASAAALRRTMHLEQEELQIRLSNQWVQPHEEPDLWHWAKLTQVDPEPFRTVFALPDLTGTGPVRVRMAFRGLSEINVFPPLPDKPADHLVEIRLNGELVRTETFEKRNEHTVAFELPAGLLGAGENTLELLVPKRSLPGAADALVDVVMFDYIRLDYPIAGQLDDAPLPIQVAQPGTVSLAGADGSALRLYGADGSRHQGRRQDDRWLFDAVAAGDYQPVAGDGYGSPVRVRPAPPARWQDVDQGYDYLLIAHPSLLEASRPLAEHHRGNGLRVAEIDVEHLYDEFNHGVVHPRAIRDFIAHAYHNWPAPRPRFVLLVGDASFDIRSDRAEDSRYAKWANMELLIPGQFGEIPGGEYQNTDKVAAKRNLVPTWQYPSEEGHSAADNYFVAVDGDDWLPDLALGRFTVVEPEEVAGIVAKTIRYANSTDFGAWRQQSLFVTDTNMYFQNESARMAGGLEAEGFQALQVYPSNEETDNEAHIGTLNQAFNEGQLLVHFIGHGGRYIWRTGPPDLTRNHDLFTLDHVGNLSNGDRLPMVLSMSCYSAPFDHPNADSIGERFLREPDKGAIAVFAASWRNSPIPQFSDAAISELMTPGATIGEALMRAKQTLTNQWNRTLVETYNLLGDPAVVLNRPSLPLRMQAGRGGAGSSLEVLADEAPVNGQATVQWLGADGAVLARTTREMRGSRLRVDVPADARDAHLVTLHLADYGSRRDGIARLTLVEPAAADADPAAIAGDGAPAAGAGPAGTGQ
jgi:hypothetical protein